jgi:hypothetical protein
MTPLKELSGLNRNLQNIESEDKIRRVKSSKKENVNTPKKIEDSSQAFSRKDSVQISSDKANQVSQKETIARYVREVKQLPQRNTPDLFKIQQRIESGFYDKPQVVDDVAQSVLSTINASSISKENQSTRKPLSDEKLNLIKEKIQNGDYNSQTVLDVIANKILNSI